MSKVLVTGGSGFIGSHAIVQLLAAGYQVRTTVRDLKREGDVRAMLRNGGVEPDGRLSFVAANLTSDAGWTEAVAGCEYVLHVASPLPANAPKHEDELIGLVHYQNPAGSVLGSKSEAVATRRTTGPSWPSSPRRTARSRARALSSVQYPSAKFGMV